MRADISINNKRLRVKKPKKQRNKIGSIHIKIENGIEGEQRGNTREKDDGQVTNDVEGSPEGKIPWNNIDEVSPSHRRSSKVIRSNEGLSQSIQDATMGQEMAETSSPKRVCTNQFNFDSADKFTASGIGVTLHSPPHKAGSGSGALSNIYDPSLGGPAGCAGSHGSHSKDNGSFGGFGSTSGDARMHGNLYVR